jgi:hypothetical protein
MDLGYKGPSLTLCSDRGNFLNQGAVSSTVDVYIMGM